MYAFYGYFEFKTMLIYAFWGYLEYMGIYRVYRDISSYYLHILHCKIMTVSHETRDPSVSVIKNLFSDVFREFKQFLKKSLNVCATSLSSDIILSPVTSTISSLIPP